MGKTAGEFIVILIEILRQKKMAVGVIIVGLDAELRALHTALGADGL